MFNSAGYSVDLQCAATVLHRFITCVLQVINNNEVEKKKTASRVKYIHMLIDQTNRLNLNLLVENKMVHHTG